MAALRGPGGCIVASSLSCHNSAKNRVNASVRGRAGLAVLLIRISGSVSGLIREEPEYGGAVVVTEAPPQSLRQPALLEEFLDGAIYLFRGLIR